MWMMSIARAAVALLSLTVVPAAAKPTAEQLAYAATFADVGAGTKPAALPAAHSSPAPSGLEFRVPPAPPAPLSQGNNPFG